MGSRERKREERRKRKRRSSEPSSSTEPATAVENGGAAQASAESFPERYGRRSEERNQAVRDSLEPLPKGERPGAVTVAAAVSAVLAAILIVSAVLAVAGVEIRGEEPNPVPIVLFAAAVLAMTWGLWRARYWAVLGFQMVLVLLMLSSALGLLRVGNAFEALGTVVLLAGASTLFYFMIRAMARIQMPNRPADPEDR